MPVSSGVKKVLPKSSGKAGKSGGMGSGASAAQEVIEKELSVSLIVLEFHDCQRTTLLDCVMFSLKKLMI